MMAVRRIAFEADYRQTLAEISSYFEQEQPRRMPVAQRLALLSTLAGAYEDDDCRGAAKPLAGTLDAVLEAA